MTDHTDAALADEAELFTQSLIAGLLRYDPTIYGPEKWDITLANIVPIIRSAALTFASRTPAPVNAEQPESGYKEAFYKIAELLDIPAQPLSPRVVFETQIYPALEAALAAAKPKETGRPTVADPDNLSPIHVRLLERGVRSKWIGLSDNAGVRVGELVALGQLERAGLVRASVDELPPGPPTRRPREITDAGRAALAALTNGDG